MSLTFASVSVVEMNTLRAQLRDEWCYVLRLGLQSLPNTSDGEDLLRVELLHFKQALAAQELKKKKINVLKGFCLRVGLFTPMWGMGGGWGSCPPDWGG